MTDAAKDEKTYQQGDVPELEQDGEVQKRVSHDSATDDKMRILGVKQDIIDEDVSSGPIKDRHCTDVFCVCLWAAHVILFICIAGVGLGNGQVSKLYSPRDYAGDYCGLERQWNDGRNHKGYEKVIKTMNVSGAVEDLAKELVCSSAAEAVIRNMTPALTDSQLDAYMCGCCKTPCPACRAVLPLADHDTTGDARQIIGDKMSGLTSTLNAGSLYSVGGPNGGTFNTIFSQLDKYFNDACVKSCDAVLQTTDREYTYTMDYDSDLKYAWDRLKVDTGDIGHTIRDSFTFGALPSSLCNYDPKYCVPFPGITFTDLTGAGFCTFELSSDIARYFNPDSLAGMASAYDEVDNPDDKTSEDSESGGTMDLGSMMGSVIESWDATVSTFCWSFVSGFLLLVLIRLCVRPVVWGAILLTILLTFGAGVALVVRAGQCQGTSFVNTGRAYTASAQQVGTSVANSYFNQYSGTEYAVLDLSYEAATGNGEDYNGLQTQTLTGKKCQPWDSKSPHQQSMKDRYPSANLTENYCRNPNGAVYIWCYTMDEETRWELCTTLDSPAWHRKCPQGYIVKDKTSRKIMDVAGGILICISVVELLITLCLIRKISKMISMMEAAAQFVMQTPFVLVVPVVQALIAFAWVFSWCYFAAYIVANVPDGYTSTEYFATYAEAYGTYKTPGKCRDKWPAGSVYKYGGDVASASDPCSGNKGDVTGITPKCWACKPPRYIFDQYFAYCLLSLQWNNLLVIAAGQCIVAGAAAHWFFAPIDQKFRSRKIGPATRNALRYHFGSLCFGSFILALVWLIKWVLYYFQKQAQMQKNRVMECVLKVTGYLVACFERCLQFLNKNAYIQIAILGKNFCVSAANAFCLLLRHMATFGLLAILSWLLQALGIVFIMANTCLFGYMMLQGLCPHVSPVAPMLIYLVIGYVVGKLYMTVFALAVDSILQCAIIQTEKSYPGDFVPGCLRAHLPHVPGYKEMDKE